MICFNCGYDIPITAENYEEVVKCPCCEALFSEMVSFKDSLNYVLLEYREGKIPFKEVRAFNLFVSISKKDYTAVDTRKGWFDPLTKRMVHLEDIEGMISDGCAQYPLCQGCSDDEKTAKLF